MPHIMLHWRWTGKLTSFFVFLYAVNPYTHTHTHTHTHIIPSPLYTMVTIMILLDNNWQIRMIQPAAP